MAASKRKIAGAFSRTIEVQHLCDFGVFPNFEIAKLQLQNYNCKITVNRGCTKILDKIGRKFAKLRLHTKMCKRNYTHPTNTVS